MLETLIINKETALNIITLLNTTPSCKEECFGENDKLTASKTFSDGKTMIIELCGLPYEPEDENIPWAQAILTDSSNTLVVSEPDCEFFKTWTLQYEDILYELDVTHENIDLLHEDINKKISSNIATSYSNNKKAFDYPFNLLYALAVRNRKEPLAGILKLLKKSLDLDHEKGLEMAVSSLSEKERLVVLHYYVKKQSYNKITKETTIGSIERVRQINNEMICKLRHQPYLNMIRYGYEASKMIEEEHLKKRKEDFLAGLYASDTNLSVKELDISTRLYYGLSRANINSLFDLANHSEEDLLGIRNLGEKSLKECKDILNVYGLALRKSQSL